MKSQIKGRLWRKLTLPQQFLMAGTIVMASAMLIVGTWVSSRIEQAVIESQGASAAIYLESFLSPLSQELAESDSLSPPAQRALIEVFGQTALGERIVSYKIWKPDGTVEYASDANIIGRTFGITDDLEKALTGKVSISFQALDELENRAEAALGIPLLEVYTPIRESWTGRIIAVVEFYERAEALENEIARASRNSWLLVGLIFLASGGLLYGIVLAGGRLIASQRQQLQAQLNETKAISAQNVALRQRAVSASSRAIAQAERTLRRIGSDLHDGPAQYMALASLRLDSALPPDEQQNKDAEQVKHSLKQALIEIRTISRGLALPDLDELDIERLTKRAVQEFSNLSDLEITVDVACNPKETTLDYAQKLCIYRFLQETLANSSRHARAKNAKVNVRCEPDAISVAVQDSGRGFEPASALKLRSDGGQGLLGMIDRAESIGGAVDIQSQPDIGTTITLTLPFGEP